LIRAEGESGGAGRGFIFETADILGRNTKLLPLFKLPQPYINEEHWYLNNERVVKTGNGVTHIIFIVI